MTSRHRQKSSDCLCGPATIHSYNVFYWISGLTFLIVGLWQQLDEAQSQLLSYLLRQVDHRDEGPELPLAYLALGVVFIGAFIVITGFFGCQGAMRGNRILLILYIVSLIVVAIGEVAVAIMVVVPHSVDFQGLEETLAARIKSSYGSFDSETQFTRAVDYVQYKFQCCGIANPSEYHLSQWQRDQPQHQKMVVPLTCCVLKEHNRWSFLNPEPKNRTLCQSEDTFQYELGRYNEGCMSKIKHWLQSQGGMYIGIGLGAAVLQILGIILVSCYLRDLRRASPDLLSRDKYVTPNGALPAHKPRTKPRRSSSAPRPPPRRPRKYCPDTDDSADDETSPRQPRLSMKASTSRENDLDKY